MLFKMKVMLIQLVGMERFNPLPLWILLPTDECLLRFMSVSSVLIIPVDIRLDLARETTPGLIQCVVRTCHPLC